MRIFSGNKNKVIISRDEVRALNATFPCSELSNDRAYWFEFDPTNGDLVDTDVPEHNDGAAALALAHDAYEFLQSV